MRKIAEINVGDKFGRLTIISDKIVRSVNGHNKSYYSCQCDCGNIVEVLRGNLPNGHTRSCGCLNLESIKTHGLSKHPLYDIWGGMKTRCYDESFHQYKDYGGRGILICDEWKNNFQAFYNWSMNNGWERHLQIDRINNDGHYEPSNCKWSTRIEQGNNTRRNRVIEIFGELKTVSEWARDERCVVSYKVFSSRIELKWNCEEALTTPSRKPNRIKYKAFNLELNPRQWSKQSICVVSYKTLIARINSGWNIIDALTISSKPEKVSAFGEEKEMVEWIEDSRCVINNATILRYRIRAGWNPEMAITTPTKRHNEETKDLCQ